MRVCHPAAEFPVMRDLGSRPTLAELQRTTQLYEGDGEIVFSLACKLVSKRPGSIYRRGDHRFGSRSKIRLRQR